MVRYSDEAFKALIASSTDFDCLPRNHQTLLLVRFLLEQGNKLFTSQDISQLYQKADLRSPADLKPIKPSPKQIERTLRKLNAAGLISFVETEEGQYGVK
jgi:hypothetical protein